MVAGGLGALSASVPVEAALPLLGWRGMFYLFAALLVASAGFLMTVPDRAALAHGEPLGQQVRTLLGIFGKRVFWRFAPQGCLSSGGFMAVQGLWAVPWLMEVNGAVRADAAGVLFLLGLAMLSGFVFVASCSRWLSRNGVAPMTLLTFGIGIGLLVEAAIIADLARPAWLWPMLGLSFSLSNIAYSQLSAEFPVELSGRVNTALNLMVFVGAFGLQWGIGALVDGLTVGGVARAQAFRITFSVLLVLQALAFGWYLHRPAPQARQSAA